MLVRPLTQTSSAFQWNGQPYSEWPLWVQNSCTVRKDGNGQIALLHNRKSGLQWIYLTEWLVKDMDDAEASWFTDKQFWATFEHATG